MDLLNPPPPSPPNPWPLRIAIVAAIAAALGGGLYYSFRHHTEIKTVERFMDALVAGDYREAHEIWQPASSYTYDRFRRDWGKPSKWGRIHSYEIVDVQSSGSRSFLVPDQETGRQRTINVSGTYSGVLVGVRINNRVEPEYIWVEKKNQSLSFPPF